VAVSEKNTDAGSATTYSPSREGGIRALPGRNRNRSPATTTTTGCGGTERKEGKGGPLPSTYVYLKGGRHSSFSSIDENCSKGGMVQLPAGGEEKLRSQKGIFLFYA